MCLRLGLVVALFCAMTLGPPSPLFLPTGESRALAQAGPQKFAGTQREVAQRGIAAELDAYWTPERMARAAPAVVPHGRTGRPAETRSSSFRSPSRPFEGIKEVGTFFWASGNAGYRFCGGTVVTSPGKNIVASAAHCFNDSDAKHRLVFVPKHHKRDPKPYGVFPIEVGQIYMYPAYLAKNGERHATNLDFAFLRTGPRSDGKHVQDVVGGFPLALNAGFGQQNTQVIGYPGDAFVDPLECTTTLKGFTTGDQTDSKGKVWKGGTFSQVDCDGFVSGTSGGPFLIPHSGGGRALAGVIGGWMTGGHSADISYSSYFGADTGRLYDAAVAGTQLPSAEAPVLGAGATWKNARQIASGYFTTDDASLYEYMDMIVLWSDGELTLYRGAGQRRGWFDKEIKLKGPNALWANHAVEITAGDFTGDNGSDLIVRWSDGELTLYPSVDERGFHGEVRLMPPNNLWKTNAKAMTAGRFSGNRWQDDLVVRWSDGELTLYQDVSARGLGTEHRLQPPNTLWTHAEDLSSGDWSSGDTWDLIVRWSDGELTNYENLTASNPPTSASENRVRRPNDLWKNHAIVITGGDYTENPWPDDTIVRWSDGEVSLYEDGDGGRLGKEHMLVAPAG